MSDNKLKKSFVEQIGKLRSQGNNGLSRAYVTYVTKRTHLRSSDVYYNL